MQQMNATPAPELNSLTVVMQTQGEHLKFNTTIFYCMELAFILWLS